MFEHGQPEEFLMLMKNLKNALDRTNTNLAARKIYYLLTLLCGESFWAFDELEIQNNGTSNEHLKFIQEGLLGYFPLIDTLSKQNRVMHHVMCKPRETLFKLFDTHLMEVNN